ncbi:SDR family NAD(P)-dependent oxidoreductase [Patulibacter defluvii]|uniref:SDR family NAD(P)-dependent oxidoreductase n=1 Tax=Patulibacter defluvii TaxID=3095358 RepID=UPI002A754BE6|nr:SDR family NAD(P)-dependent oxidoreductase [Patulibacter sp. DM4]
MLAAALDRLLDRSVVPGYTRIGLAVRRRLDGWPADPLSLSGQTALVTGGTAGIGRAAASGIARLGATVVIVGRDPQRGADAARTIAAEAGGADVRFERCDLGRLADVRALAARLTAGGAPIRLLVHDAGVMPPERTLTAEGHELAFAVNVLGPFLLTALLEPVLRAAAPARMIVVSSGGMYAQRLDVADPTSASGRYRPAAVYARTKRAEVVLAEQWAARWRGTGVAAHAMHPGWADTGGVRDALPGFHRLMGPLLRTAEQAADTIVWLAGAPADELASGGFWHDRRRRPTHRLRRTRESAAERAALWDLCRRASGWTDDQAVAGRSS